MSEELNKAMYFGAVPVTFNKARLLRNKITPEEKILWEKLKGKQICNARFRRQHPISKYIADFYCHAAFLVVELDGKIHNKQKAEDQKRDKELESLGIKTIRFSNEEVILDITNVVQKIKQIVSKRLK